MQKKRGIAGTTSRLVMRYFAGLAYIAGLTALIPLVALPVEAAPTFFSAAVGLIIFSVIVIFLQKRSLALTLKSLGRATIIPGILAAIILISGKEAVLGIMVKYTSVVEPLLRSYIENSVPKMWVLAVGYLVIGFVLWIIGSRMAEKRIRRLMKY